MATIENSRRWYSDGTLSRAPGGAQPNPDPFAFAREANAAFMRWRGASIPITWRQSASALGVTFCRGRLLVVGSLEPRDERGARVLTVSLSRVSGERPTEADILAVIADFLGPDGAVRRERRGGITSLHSVVPSDRVTATAPTLDA